MQFLKKIGLMVFGILFVFLFFRFGLEFKSLDGGHFIAIPSGVNIWGYVILFVFFLPLVASVVLNIKKKSEEKATTEQQETAEA